MAKLFQDVLFNSFKIEQNDLIAFVSDENLLISHTSANAKNAFAIEFVIALSKDGGKSWQPYALLFDSFRRTSAEQIEFNGKKTFAPHIEFEATKAFLQCRSGEDFEKFIEIYPVVRVAESFRVQCLKKKDKDGNDRFWWNLLGIEASDAKFKATKALLSEMTAHAEERRRLSEEYYANR